MCDMEVVFLICSAEKCDNLLVKADNFYRFRGLILCNVKHLHFIDIKKEIVVAQLLLLLFAWPPVCGVCLNHEVVMFQTCKVTPLYLGSVINCYISYSTLLNLLRPSLPSP